jgi:hypothetical protein
MKGAHNDRGLPSRINLQLISSINTQSLVSQSSKKSQHIFKVVEETSRLSRMGSSHVALATLTDRIWHLSVRNGKPFGSHEFIPTGTYQTLKFINGDVVRAELGLAKGGDERLVKFILGPATKVFLIHLCLARDVNTIRQHMTNFMQTGFTDEMLPVTLDFCNASPAFRSKAWSPASRRNFCARQWPFLAPVFSERTSILNLDMEPLPFIKILGSTQSGGSSFVHRVRIHPDHLKLPNPSRDVHFPAPFYPVTQN